MPSENLPVSGLVLAELKVLVTVGLAIVEIFILFTAAEILLVEDNLKADLIFLLSLGMIFFLLLPAGKTLEAVQEVPAKERILPIT